MRICHYALSAHWSLQLIMYSYSIFIPELKADTGVWTEYNEGLNQVENLHFGISGINALLIPSTACIKLKTAAWKSDFGDPSPEYSQPFLVVAIWTCPLTVWILCIFVPLCHGYNGTQESFRSRRRRKWLPCWYRCSPIRTDHSL